jgi:hypothetical protein
MSTPDDFESEGGDVATVGGTNPKYYQVAVPSFPFGGTSPDPAGGSSFVRLGSFPALNDSSIPGLSNSVNLAKLVGDSAKISAEALAAETDGSLNKYTGDFLVGFADDTRHRDGADPTKAARQAETKNLLTKGGWWDHADGNRVTTTTGDKIEVIQGNYKMVILGRQPTTGYNLGNVFITDVSGGLFQEQNACPTPCIKTVEYTLSDNEWTLFQDNGKGKVVTRFDGRQIDYFTGSNKEAYVGKNYDGTVSASGDLPTVISKTWAKKIETYTGAADKHVPLIYSSTYADTIKSETWAKDKIEAYTGDVSNAVPAIHSYTYAHEIQSYTFAASIVSTNLAVNNFTLTGGIQESITIGAQLSVFLGGKVDFSVPESIQFGTGQVKAFLSRQDFVSTEDKLAALKTDIAAASTSIANTLTSLSAGDLTLNETAQVISIYHNTLAAAVSLGV